MYCKSPHSAVYCDVITEVKAQLEIVKNKCDQACKIRACGHMIFAYFFQISIARNFLYHSATVMQFSAFSKYLISFMIQVTEFNYSVSVLRYDL